MSPGIESGRVVQVTTFAGEDEAGMWRRRAAGRDAYMALTTQRLLDMAGIGPGSRVLSLGVGTGGEAFDAARRVGESGHVVATDLSADMIAMAREEAAAAGLENIDFRVMDAQQLDFPDGSFDAVTSRNAMEFVPDLATAMAEMRRVLRPSGRTAHSVWSTAARNPRVAGPLQAMKSLGVEPPAAATYRLALRLASRSGLSSPLRKAGFHHIESALVPLVADYASLDEAVETCMELTPTRELVALLGPDGAAGMRRWLIRRWARYGDASGTHLPGEQLVVGGRA